MHVRMEPMDGGHQSDATLPRLHASSNGAGRRPDLKMIVGSSSYSPNSASPDVANATTPALVVARFSAALRAASDDLHRIGVSALSRAPVPVLNAWTR